MFRIYRSMAVRCKGILKMYFSIEIRHISAPCISFAPSFFLSSADCRGGWCWFFMFTDSQIIENQQDKDSSLCPLNF
jgi:hypothetical protein